MGAIVEACVCEGVDGNGTGTWQAGTNAGKTRLCSVTRRLTLLKPSNRRRSLGEKETKGKGKSKGKAKAKQSRANHMATMLWFFFFLFQMSSAPCRSHHNGWGMGPRAHIFTKRGGPTILLFFFSIFHTRTACSRNLMSTHTRFVPLAHSNRPRSQSQSTPLLSTAWLGGGYPKTGVR